VSPVESGAAGGADTAARIPAVPGHSDASDGERRRLVHDLRNTVSAILAFARALDMDTRLPDDLRHDAGLLLAEARRLRELVGVLVDEPPPGQSADSQADQRPPEPPAGPAPRGRKARRAVPGRILIVEDEDAVRLLLRSYLERLGWTVDEAPGVSEALARLEAGPVDLLLTDRHLGDADGIDLAVDAVERHPELDGRVILMTADSADELPRPDRRTTAPRWLLSKPFELDEVGLLIDAVLAAAGPRRRTPQRGSRG
jgi:CheY-like chemotaxis protein